MAEKKIICSKRFPQPDFGELEEKAMETAQAIRKTSLWPKFEEYLRKIEGDCVYVFRADKLEGCRRFIDRAKQFSQDFQIDMDVEEHDHFISVDLDLGCGPFEGECKRALCELLDLCDWVICVPRREELFGFKLVLNYETHERCFAGNRME